MDAAALATKLGLTEAKVTAALEKVRAAQQPQTPPAQGTKPTEAERQAREKARATALAKELGVSEAKVQAALDAIKADREAGRKTELSSRLDTAVKAGTLSAADKASVLKAFDAGVTGWRAPVARPAPAPAIRPPRVGPGPCRARAASAAGWSRTAGTPALPPTCGMPDGGHPAYRRVVAAARRAIGAGMPRGPASIW